MIKREKTNEICQKLLTSQEPSIDVFRKNLYMYVNDKDITLSDIADSSNVPLGTLNSFLYGKTKDINLTTALKISLALNTSVDELAGSLMITEDLRRCINTCRTLSSNDMALIFWFIEYLQELSKELPPDRLGASVMQVVCNKHGNLKIATEYKKVDITHLDDEYKGKIFFGINMPCSHYLPTYCPNDILLIANDREPDEHEHVIIQRANSLYIARCAVENDIVKYYSIRDGKQRAENEHIMLIGYIVGVLKPNGRFIARD